MPANNVSGYVLLALPNNQVQPLTLLTYQRKSEANSTSARVDNIFVDSEVALPLVSKDFVVSSDINKSLAIDVSVAGHISLLQGLLEFLKISALFKLDKNKSLRVHLLNAQKNTVNEFELDAFINTARLNTKGRSFVEMLGNDELYVVTDVLKCKKYSMEYIDKKSSKAEIKMDAPKFGDAGVDINTSKEINDSSVYEGDDYITIAIKAYRIHSITEKSGEQTYRLRKDEKLEIVQGDEDFPGEMLNTEIVKLQSPHEPVRF